MRDADNEYLHRQLVRLGDMLGDGDCEPWVAKEYKKVATALGYMPKKKRKAPDNNAIDAAMCKRLSEVKCPCGNELKQTRSGSMVGICTKCCKRFKLLKRGKA